VVLAEGTAGGQCVIGGRKGVERGQGSGAPDHSKINGRKGQSARQRLVFVSGFQIDALSTAHQDHFAKTLGEYLITLEELDMLPLGRRVEALEYHGRLT